MGDHIQYIWGRSHFSPRVGGDLTSTAGYVAILNPTLSVLPAPSVHHAGGSGFFLGSQSNSRRTRASLIASRAAHHADGRAVHIWAGSMAFAAIYIMKGIRIPPINCTAGGPSCDDVFFRLLLITCSNPEERDGQT